MFRRRDTRAPLRALADAIYPPGGWARAFHYIKHRERRLPDPPHKIARGIFAGVFTTFTPFYGFHFLVAAVIAKLLRGNIIAALLATFFGNPLTYLPIGVASLKTGYFLLGMRPQSQEEVHRSLGGKFMDAGGDLKNNFIALFTDQQADWSGLRVFYDEVYFPYMIGGIIPGIITALVFYYLSVPVIARKLAHLKKKAAAKAEARAEAEAQEAAREAGANDATGATGGGSGTEPRRPGRRKPRG